VIVEEDIAVRCYLCGHEKHELVSAKIRYEQPRKAFQCSNCGLFFLYPQMTKEEERIFYEKEYGVIYSEEKGTTPKDLFNARLPDAKAYYELVKSYLSEKNDCLEVGCASGYFLATIKDKVKSVTGFETHTELRSYCKDIGINMIDRLEDGQDRQFDRIFMFFLLEHLGDPIGYLNSLSRVLKNGGYLFIEIPNVEDALLSLYDIPKFVEFYFTPAHQFYYSRKTLADMLRKAGFNDFEIKAVQRYDLSNHMHWMMAGKPGGMGRYDHVFDQDLLKAYAETLKTHWLCDTLFAVVKKTEG
jgi:SAM-dependent methyltransferase